jgi:RNA-directed DNA polymerase
MMHGHRKSDSSIGPTKPPNKAEPEAKEAVEGRELAEGNLLERNMFRTQSRQGMPSALERIRQAARRDKRQQFTALLHHVYDVERLRAAYFALRREAAPGIDGETWRQYGENLQRNLEDLSERLRRGAYRAKPVRRAYITKVGKPVSFGRSECRCWKIRLSSAPPWRCLTHFTKRTLPGFPMGLDPREARIRHWMRLRLGS